MKNYTIDRFKFIAAIGVVLIHVFAFIDSTYNSPLAELQWPRALFNYAVPLFFAVSGFLISGRDLTYLRHYAANMLRLFIISSLFYFLANWLLALGDAWVMQEDIVKASSAYLSGKSFNLFLQGTIGSYHLWYLWACWVGVWCLIALLYIQVGDRVRLTVVFILYLVSLYCIQEGLYTDFVRYGGFPKALMYLSLGHYVGKNDHYWRYNWRVLSCWVSLYVVLFGFIYQGPFLEILFIPVIYLLLTFLNRYPGKPTLLSSLGEQSDAIYIFHALGINLYGSLMVQWHLLRVSSLSLRIMIISTFAVVFSLLMQVAWQSYFYRPLDKLLQRIPGLSS